MELQRLQALLQPTFTRSEPVAKPVGAAAPDFGQVLQQAVQQIEQDQQTAADAATRLVTGQTTDVASVMIASQRASLSLSLALQVRNKVIDAYQEIMRMPL
jgi:flagellar hook-basal body complex protein FliE